MDVRGKSRLDKGAYLGKTERRVLKMSLLKAGGAHTSKVKTKTGESYQIIWVYPETTERDVQSAFRSINKDMQKKETIQPITNIKIYDFVFQKLVEGKDLKEILKALGETSYVFSRTSISEIIEKMKTGL